MPYRSPRISTIYPRKLIGISLSIVGLLILVAIVGQIFAEESAENTTKINISQDVVVPNAKKLGINLGSHDRYGANQILKNVIVNPGFEAGEYAMIFHVADGATRTQVQQDNWDAGSWTNDAAKIGQPNGFWDGAEFEILTGNAAGRTGTIEKHSIENSDVPGPSPHPTYSKLNTFVFDQPGTIPEKESAIVVRQKLDGNAIVQYDMAATVDVGETRPGSPGEQSLILHKRDVSFKPSWRYYFDTLQTVVPSAGNMVTVEGEWCIDLWAKSEFPADKFSVYFWRQGTGDFYFDSNDDGAETLSTKWRKFSFRSDEIIPKHSLPARGGIVNGDLPVRNVSELMSLPPILEVGVRVGMMNEGDIWIDDIALYRCDERNPTIFTDNYVDLLKELNPGILRDWGAQLGSTLDNQLAVDFGRKTTGFRPHDRSAKQWHYGLPDFLALAKEVDAEPWYVIPPSFTDEEMANLAAYLSAPADAHPYAKLRAEHGQEEPWTEVFSRIHLEFGNEMWGANAGGDPFIGATARGGVRLGEMADVKLDAFKSSRYYDSADINLIVGGQVGYPNSVRQIVENSNEQDTIAIAPYFGYDVSYANNDEELYYPTYARILQDLMPSESEKDTQFVDQMKSYIEDYGSNEDLAIYEINFHSTIGDADAPERNKFVSGLNGALALPLYMLTYQKEAGIVNSAAFQTSQYAYKFGSGTNDYANIWGLMRDIEGTGRKRPTWLGVELVNRAVMGNMLETVHSGDDPVFVQRPLTDMGRHDAITGRIELPMVHSFAFQDKNKISLIVFNLSLTDAQEIVLDMDVPAYDNAILHQLNRFSNSEPHYEISDNNEAAEKVSIRSVRITNFGKNYAFKMPPNSIYVYEWSTKQVYLPIVHK